jgi:aerobic carbon-monoxide dehydrogenase small subunit
MVKIELKVNGTRVLRDVEDRTLLVQLLREHLGLTGTHVGCDTTQCGCCVVHMDGRPVKSCTVLAAMADGSEVVTIEGIGSPEALHPMQEAFREYHALQCGFCTPGMIMMAIDILRRHPDPDEHTARHELEGNLCRCTGYENIVRAIQGCAARLRETSK